MSETSKRSECMESIFVVRNCDDYDQFQKYYWLQLLLCVKLSNFSRNEERSDECRRIWSLFRHIMSCLFAESVKVLRRPATVFVGWYVEKLELDLFSGFILDFFLSFVFLFDNVSYRKEIKISFRHYVNMLVKIFRLCPLVYLVSGRFNSVQLTFTFSMKCKEVTYC